MSTIDRAAVRTALLEQLRLRATKPMEGVSDDTAIYRDLGINGQDLWEIFAWASATCDTDCAAVTPRDYDINEPPALFGFGRYKSVTIGAMLDAIERGVWVVPER